MCVSFTVCVCLYSVVCVNCELQCSFVCCSVDVILFLCKHIYVCVIYCLRLFVQRVCVNCELQCSSV